MPAQAAGPFEVRNIGLKEIALVCDGEAVSLKPRETLLAHRVKFSSGAVRIVAREGSCIDLAPVYGGNYDPKVEAVTSSEPRERPQAE
jgi:hypothetical protein